MQVLKSTSAIATALHDAVFCARLVLLLPDECGFCSDLTAAPGK